MMKHIWRSPAASDFSIRELRGLVLDWAGTTIDYGSQAPVEVFRAVFQKIGIEVTEAEARGPMGQAKIDHIRAMLQMDRIQSKWQAIFGRPSRQEDVEDLYENFLPLQKTVLADHSQVIPGSVRMKSSQGDRHLGKSTAPQKNSGSTLCQNLPSSTTQ